jgi:hypothetical protein
MTETATVERCVGAVAVADTNDIQHTAKPGDELAYFEAREFIFEDHTYPIGKPYLTKAERKELQDRQAARFLYSGEVDPSLHHVYRHLEAMGIRYLRSDMETPEQYAAHRRRALEAEQLNTDIYPPDRSRDRYIQRRQEWLDAVNAINPRRLSFGPQRPYSDERLAPWRWDLMTGEREEYYDEEKGEVSTRQRDILWNGEVVDIARVTNKSGKRLHVPEVFAGNLGHLESAIARAKEFAAIEQVRSGQSPKVTFKGKVIKPGSGLEIFRDGDKDKPPLRERLVMEPSDTYTKAQAGSEGATDQEWEVRLYEDDRSRAALYGHDPTSLAARTAPAPDENIRGVTTAGLDLLQAYLDRGGRLGADQRAAFTFLVEKVRLYRKMLDLSSELVSSTAGLNPDRLGELERKLDAGISVKLQKGTLDRLRVMLEVLMEEVAIRHEVAVKAGSLDPEWSEVAERYARLRPELERLDPSLIHDFRKRLYARALLDPSHFEARRDGRHLLPPNRWNYRALPPKGGLPYWESYSTSGMGDGALVKVRRRGLLVKGLRQNRSLQNKGGRVPPQVISEHIGDAFWALVEPPKNFDYFNDAHGETFADWVVKVVRRTGGMTTDGVQVGSRVKRDATRDSLHAAPPEEPDYSVYGSEWSSALEGAAFELSEESGAGTLEVPEVRGTPGYGGPDDLYGEYGIPPGPIYRAPGQAMLLGLRYAATSRKGDLAWKFLADLHHYSTSKGKAALNTKEPLPAAGPSSMLVYYRPLEGAWAA